MAALVVVVSGCATHSTSPPTATTSTPSHLQGVVTPRGVEIQFVSTTVGWLIQPDSGAILGTTDGGSTWSPSYSGTSRAYAIDFIDGDHGWALAADTLLRTTDGGLTPYR